NSYEEKILVKELQRQGLSAKNAGIILNNLRKYNNNGGFSLENNFISNSFNYVKNSITKQFEEFSETILGYFKNNTKSVSSGNIAKVYNDKIDANYIEKRISELYNKELPYDQKIDNSNDMLKTSIIKMHTNIVEGISNLDKTIGVSEKVCDSQNKGEGNCTTKK
ncbi:MAG: hypothetical protein PHE25_04880, partial [Candidatus Gracilibacteria bacterium]|nr:hypothetical protein [Candidatus Gracilibacteria bacterium]